MNWLVDLTERGIAKLQADEDAAHYAAFADGTQIAYIGADWYAGFFKDNVPDLAGKWKAAPLPAWEAGGTRTSCWGGTGLTIVESGDNTEAALDFLEFAMLSVEGNVRRFELTNLFPPFIPAMDNERLHSEDPYFTGQDLGALFAELGPEVPPQYQSPFRSQLQDLFRAAQIDILEGNRSAEDAFNEIANTIRDEMEFES
jgi:ABC-type glycerol-3-phosphate transport system substrate-binding protein